MKNRTHLRASRLPASRRGQAGFTLIELVVALTAGLLVSAAAYLLARNSMTSYQEESRIATSQLSVSIGMGRLQADLARAGYMSSPNIAADPRLCSIEDATDVPISALTIRNGTATNTGLATATYGYGAGNANAPIEQPDILVVTGNLTSAEQFEFRGCTSSQCFLALDRGPMVRLRAAVGDDVRAIRSVFVTLKPDNTVLAPRFARIVDQTGKESYVRVTNVTVTGTPITAITLSIQAADGGTPTNPGTECGFVDRGSGLINPVSIVRYRIGQICNPQDPASCAGSPYAPALVATGPDTVTGESTRTDLLREELTPAAATADKFALGYTVSATGLASREIVAEYAVELDVAAMTDTSAVGSPGGAGPLAFLDSNGGTALDDFTDDTPQKLRSLRVVLSTRARVPDRGAPSPGAANNVATRFLLTPIPTNSRNRYARMRTLQTEIQLPNLMGLTW